MFCNNCGKELSENEIYCNKCGTKVNNKSTNNAKVKYKFILSNWIVFVLFIIEVILLIVAVFDEFINIMSEMPASNGLMILAVPVIAIPFCIPQFAGATLSAINIAVRKHILVIISFVLSLISVVSIMLSHTMIPITGIWYSINLILSIVLSVILLVKVIKK